MTQDRKMAAISLLAGLSSFALPAFAMAGASESGSRYGHHMMGGSGMIIGPVIMIVVLAIVVGVVVLMVRWLGGVSPAPRGQQRAERTALDILSERFAKGEIDKDEFEERRRVLEG